MWDSLDPYLLLLYGFTGVEVLDGLIGTVLVALLTTIIGEFTTYIGLRVNGKHLDKLQSDLKKYGDLSKIAMEKGDEPSYKALNRQANDAFGKVFFNRFGLSAASLWPAFFALDWLQHQFMASGIPIPFYPSGADYLVVFLLCYIAVRIVCSRVKKRLPYFSNTRSNPSDEKNSPVE